MEEKIKKLKIQIDDELKESYDTAQKMVDMHFDKIKSNIDDRIKKSLKQGKKYAIINLDGINNLIIRCYNENYSYDKESLVFFMNEHAIKKIKKEKLYNIKKFNCNCNLIIMFSNSIFSNIFGEMIRIKYRIKIALFHIIP